MNMETQKSKIKSQNLGTAKNKGLKTRCYVFALDVLKYTDSFPNKRSAWVVADQLTRSGTSIGANLVEARASSSRKEFKWFNEVSLRSANESLYWLALSRDSGIGNKTRANTLIDECTELTKMLASGVMKLKDN